MTTVEAFAPAKINLTLHVTGRRTDGYHELDSLVAFAHYGDTIVVEPADTLSLDIDGPFAQDLSGQEGNLVLEAARLVAQGRGAGIRLTKRLPVASGLGGGSADAAATIRALCDLWSEPWPDPAALATLGSDVPVCLRCGLTRMRGRGEELLSLGISPRFHLLLVNPGVAVPTRRVFDGLAGKSNAPMAGPLVKPGGSEAEVSDWIGWLGRQRNDLEAPAVALYPVIGEVLDALRALPGCCLARMSGSGATCFALFQQDFEYRGHLAARHPEWWVVKTDALPFLFDQSERERLRTT